jgi:hypothetical protein
MEIHRLGEDQFCSGASFFQELMARMKMMGE